MQACIICKLSVLDKPLHRTKPTGQPDAGWMCESCIAKHEPDLHASLKADGDIDIVNDIAEALGGGDGEHYGICALCGDDVPVGKDGLCVDCKAPGGE